MGELYKDIDARKAETAFNQALKLAKTESDRRVIHMKLSSL